jgi:hypothetical protein
LGIGLEEGLGLRLSLSSQEGQLAEVASWGELPAHWPTVHWKTVRQKRFIGKPLTNKVFISKLFIFKQLADKQSAGTQFTVA